MHRFIIVNSEVQNPIIATNKNTTICYQELDRCFRNPEKSYFIDDLVEVSNHALLEIDSNSSGVKKRQV